jgi:ComF family protein
VQAKHALVSLVQGALDWLAPLHCAGCDGLIGRDAIPFCGACAILLDDGPDALRAPARRAAAYAYGGPLADAIGRLKYEGRSDLGAGLAQLLARAALAYAGAVDAVIALPLHPARLRARGYNQSALLARPVARALGVPLVHDALQRVRDTPPQAGLSRVERLANVRGAFRARPTRAQRCARVLLIDDVRTTGSSLDAGAEALLAAGCSEVITLALAAAAR